MEAVKKRKTAKEAKAESDLEETEAKAANERPVKATIEQSVLMIAKVEVAVESAHHALIETERDKGAEAEIGKGDEKCCIFEPRQPHPCTITMKKNSKHERIS